MKMKSFFSYPVYYPGKDTLRSRRRTFLLIWLICGALLFSIPLSDVSAEAQEGDKAAPKSQSGQDLGQVGAKLANPLANLWALSMSFNMPEFLDGDVNTGDPEVGADMIFQPVMPIPLYGEGAAAWRLITRPIIPLIFSQPIPIGFNDFDHKGGIGDIQLPLLVNLPESISGKWLFGAGQVSIIPSATSDVLGSDQWAMGPAVVLGYKTKKAVGGIFPNYLWKIGSAGQGADTPDINQGTLLYFFNYMLPNAWQVGTNPTITYNHEADSGNKWNVPVGGYVGKTIKFGKLPVNIKVGAEYSVVSEDDFGKRHSFRFLITPVIPGLIQNAIFGK